MRCLLLAFTCFAAILWGVGCSDSKGDAPGTVRPSEFVPTSVSTPTPTASTPASQSSREAASPDFTMFAQGWSRHGFGLTVSADGQATASWRIYKWCKDDPTAPCDDFVGNLIISGGRAIIVFDRVEGQTAYGHVLGTTDANGLSGNVTLTVQEYGLAVLTSGASSATLCGPKYPDEAPDSIRRTFPCGA